MKLQTKKYIQTTSFNFLENWSVSHILETSFSYNEDFELVRIGQFLTKIRKIILIENGKTYQRVTVKINNGGVVSRNTEEGENIGTKQQYLINSGQFLMSKIDARNGAFGLVPVFLDKAIVTNDFPVFDIDTTIINPQFFVLITTTKEFIKFAQSCSSGTTNRQRINVELFLNVKIPIPSLTKQNRIVDAYNKKTQLAEEQEQKAKKLERDIEDFLFNELGISKLETKRIRKTLQFISFEDIDRWDVFAEDNRIYKQLKNSKYSLKKLGDIYSFPKQSWKKSEINSKEFNYVELGAIDPIFGITSIKNIQVKDAPSRATQIIYKNDLIIGTTRPYLKRFTLINKENDKNICSSGFCIISPSPKYDLIYLKEFLMSYFGIEQLKNRMTGATYPAITTSEIKEIRIPLPPISKQQEIAKKIEGMKEEIIKLTTQAKENREQAIREFENEIFIKE